MNAKKLLDLTIVLSVLVAGAVLGACDLGLSKNATVTLSAGLSDATSRAVSPGDVVTTVRSYKVVFMKIEIGNSEDDKYTLWESSSPDGEEMDIAQPVSFEGVADVAAGTYNYLRFTIGTTLNVEGAIDDGGTVYEGSGSEELSADTYLFGVDIPNGLGEATITEPIEIVDGTSIALVFDVAGTVTYLSGPADGAILTVTKPAITATVE